jgi:putative DNA primase/helicase
VLNWILEGLQRLVANREFTYSETSERIVEKYREDADSARQFIKEFEYRKTTPLDQTQYTLANDLHDEYKKFCLTTGNSNLTRNNFYNRLEGMGFQKSKTAKGQVFHIVTDKIKRGGVE